MSSQPAHLTKHIPILSYSFNSNVFLLSQISDGVSNGTALWLGGQCLAMYLAQTHNKFKSFNLQRPRAIELGSGIGLTALAMSSLGWDVLATDVFHVISSVLQKNIKNNPTHSGTVHIRELDWTVQPEQWRWDHELYIASHSSSLSDPAAQSSGSHYCPPFDLIYSADTVYSADLLEPMLRTLHTLSTLSAAASPSHRFPLILLCIERRDSLLADRLLGDAENIWHFNVERIPHKKLVKAVERSGVHWNKADWEDVELWKLKLDPR